eukprot:g32495.t1
MQVPLTVMAAMQEDMPGPLRLMVSRGRPVAVARGPSPGAGAADGVTGPADVPPGARPLVLCSDRLNFLSHFGAGLWTAAVLTRLAGLQELRLENLPMGVVALQHLFKLTLGKGCTGLKEQQAGQELAFALAKLSPLLKCLNLAGSDATPVMLLGMVEAFSAPSTPGLDGLQAGPPPRLLQLTWKPRCTFCGIDVGEDEGAFGNDFFPLLQALQLSLGCPCLRGIRTHKDFPALNKWRLCDEEAQQTA